MGTTTISYQQTYKDLPVWEAGISVTIQPEPMRVTASQSSVHPISPCRRRRRWKPSPPIARRGSPRAC
jgi:hypothetical protein